MKLTEIVTKNLTEDKSISQLHGQTSMEFPNREINSKKVRLKRKSFSKNGSNSLIVKAIIQGEESDYESVIQFDGVEFTTPNDPEGIRAGNLYIHTINSTTNNAKVSCNCRDFRWSFAWYNSSDASLIGNPPAPYAKKTARPPRNPAKVSGMCKHLECLHTNLQAEMLFNS